MEFDYNLIQTVIGILGGSGIIGGLTFFIRSFRQRIYVKLVTKKNDSDLDDFILLYDEVIEENTRITPEEILRFIGCHKPVENITVCDYLFLCKKERQVIGFLKAMYCIEKNMLFIAYLGIKKDSGVARKLAALRLYKKIRKLVISKHKGCKVVIFEVEGSKSTKSNAKLRLFKNAAERYGNKCYQFDINYLQPEIPSDKGSIQKEETALMFIPIDCEFTLNKYIDKTILLNYLDFIYNKIYSRVYIDNDLNQVYKSYLTDLLNEYVKTLPEKIRLI
jgi:hypothetical protein